MFFAFLYSVFVCFYGLMFMFFMFFGFVGFAFYCTFVCVCVYVCLYLYCGVSQMVTTPSFAVFCADVCVCACMCVCVCVCVCLCLLLARADGLKLHPSSNGRVHFRVVELGLDKSGAETEFGAVLEYRAKIEGDYMTKAEIYEEFNFYWVLQLTGASVAQPHWV